MYPFNSRQFQYTSIDSRERENINKLLNSFPGSTVRVGQIQRAINETEGIRDDLLEIWKSILY